MKKYIILTVITVLLFGCKSNDINSLNQAEQKALEKLMILACQRTTSREGDNVSIFLTTEIDSLPESGKRLSRPVHSVIAGMARFYYISTKQQARDRLRAEFQLLSVQIEYSSFIEKIIYGKRSIYLLDFEVNYKLSPESTSVLLLTIVPTKIKID